ncbi:MAG TPA: polysaccharide deacetylase family protein [Ohtaekwangia sp.]|nr:polysaccharide deacetylase family protein [Ohtaekwangia sp.]
MIKFQLKVFAAFILLLQSACSYSQAPEKETYAEKLGFPKGAKVLILHVDDAGMSWDSNEGVIKAMEKGVANSVSIMMPCPWVPGFMHYLKEHPHVDAGLHLTLTSEWKDYRWGPLSGKPAVPGLVDEEGAFWSSVPEVIAHAKADEVEREIRSQVERSKAMGWNPTHMDSHMGTLFATPEFLQRYIKVGIEMQIPVMLPGGHNTMIAESNNIPPAQVASIQEAGKMVWDNGLPVLDDLHNSSYGWYDGKEKLNDTELRKFATENYIRTIKELKPGLTMVIMHCTAPSETFKHISDSEQIRKGDLLAMTDPVFKKFILDEGIILTTWRDLMIRRKNVK